MFPTTFSLTVPRDRTGALDIALEGLDGGDVAVANGDNTVDLRAGDNVSVTIDAARGRPRVRQRPASTAGEDCDDGDRVTSGSCDYSCRTIGRRPGHRRHGWRRRRRWRRRRVAEVAAWAAPGARACTIELLTNGNFDGTVRAGRRTIRPGGR